MILYLFANISVINTSNMDTNLDSRRVTFDPTVLSASAIKSSKGQVSRQESKDDGNKQLFQSLSSLFIFSLAMLVIPLGCYFFIRHIALGSSTAAAIGAIVSVQLIIASMVYKAYADSDDKLKNSKNQCNHKSKKKM